MSNYPSGVSDRDIDRIYGSRRNDYIIVTYDHEDDLEDYYYIYNADKDKLKEKLEELENLGLEIVDYRIAEDAYDDFI